MSQKGNEIVLSVPPKGVFTEGIIGSGLTPKPGTIMVEDFTVALNGGRFTWKLWAAGADGDQRATLVLLPDHLQGRTADTAYAAGERCFGYYPAHGEELNVRVADVGGTAAFAAGAIMMVDTGTGLLIATTGSPEAESFVLLEATVEAGGLAWARYQG